MKFHALKAAFVVTNWLFRMAALFTGLGVLSVVAALIPSNGPHPVALNAVFTVVCGAAAIILRALRGNIAIRMYPVEYLTGILDMADDIRAWAGDDDDDADHDDDATALKSTV